MMDLQAIIARNNAPVNEARDDFPPVPGIGTRFCGKGPGAPSDPLPFAVAHPDATNRAPLIGAEWSKVAPL